MTEGRIQRTVSADGTEIAGRVDGEGQPVVLIHGILGDGEVWDPLLPHLTDTFTCYRVDTRGRGLSGDSEDLSSERRLEDLVAFVDSVGRPVGVVGHSLGALMALHVASRSDRVSAVVAYEPSVIEILGNGKAGYPDLKAGFMHMAEKAGEGRPADAAEAFFAQFTEPDELHAMRATGFLDHNGRNVPVDLRAAQQPANAPPLNEVLPYIKAPLLLLKGSGSTAWFHDGVDYVVDHAPHSEVRTLHGPGHFGPFLAPRAVAAELKGFLGG